jgi:hypothetical protein
LGCDSAHWLPQASAGRLREGKAVSTRESEAANMPFGAGEALAFTKDEWARVWSTKASLEQRAISLITTSGVLVTLAFGFTAAVAKGNHFANFTAAERDVLIAALALFVVSAVIALTVNQPKSYAVPDFRDLLGIPLERKVEGKPLERFHAALKEGRAENDRKALRLTIAFWSQIAAIITLSVVVGLVTAQPSAAEHHNERHHARLFRSG